MPELKEQVVVITGASAGIGAATARMLARRGAHVVLVARRHDRLSEVEREIGNAGGTALAITADITSSEDRERIVRETMTAFGRLDALVNNAGYGQRGPVEIVPAEAIRANFETNLFALIALTQLVIPIMREQQSGRIVNISSVAGRIAAPYMSIYGATKFALEAVSDGLRVELAPFNIQVVVIQPGYIVTDFIAVADEIARPLIESASPYRTGLAGTDRRYERAKKLAAPPEAIADLVAKALTARKPRTRYAAPAHAKLALWLRRLLPDAAIDWAMRRELR